MHRLPYPDIVGLTRIFPPLFVFIALIMLAPPDVHAAKFYRWVDEDGQVHYSDKVPPEDVRHKREELNDRGIVVKTVDKAKTPEQLAEEERQAKVREAEARKRKEVEIHDQWLLSNYRNEEDLVRARDDKIEAIEAAAKLTRERVETLKKKLEELRAQAANHERAGKAVPKELLTEISDIDRQIWENMEFHLKKKQEQTQVKFEYEQDLRRLKELTSRKVSKDSHVIGQ